MQSQTPIINSKPQDLALIFEFYALAVAHQKKVFHKHWQGFDKQLVAQEIEESRQYQILANGQPACIFAVTFNDPQIWKERDTQPSIYIHRIVTHPNFRGFAFVKTIIAWAKEFCENHHLEYIRMDTWADNEKLLAYYTGCGFTHVGDIKIGANSGLPKHYEGIGLNLFEIKV